MSPYDWPKYVVKLGSLLEQLYLQQVPLNGLTMDNVKVDLPVARMADDMNGFEDECALKTTGSNRFLHFSVLSLNATLFDLTSY